MMLQWQVIRSRERPMATSPGDLDSRKFARVDLRKQVFLIPAPDACWITCTVIDVSDNGICLEVGSVFVPELFGVSFTAGGQVKRVCELVWRRGGRLGARFVGAKELRQGSGSEDEVRRGRMRR